MELVMLYCEISANLRVDKGNHNHSTPGKRGSTFSALLKALGNPTDAWEMAVISKAS